MAKPQGLHIDRWLTGLVTNRAAISTPYTMAYGQRVMRNDALIDGLNMEITPQNTLARRPGFPKYCSVTYGSDVPKGISGARLNGTLYRLLNTDQKVYTFDPTTLTAIYTKTTTAQTFFQQIGNLLYFSDGAANKKWDGTTVANNGISPPASAPTVTKLNLYDTVGAVQYAHAWSPNAVYNNTTASPQNYYLLAPTNEIQWAVVPAGTTLTSQSSAPNWATGFGILGAKTVDGSMTWLNCGPIQTWLANTGLPTYYTTPFTTTSNLKAGPKGASDPFTSTGSTSANWVLQDVAHGGAPSAAFTASGGYAGATNTLQVRFNTLAVPSGATINGVVVTVTRRNQAVNTISDNLIKLVKAGSETGNNKALAGGWPGSYTAVQYGSSTDMWGATLTAANVNASNFGVDIIANATSGTSSSAGAVQSVQVAIYYSVSSSDLTGTATSAVILDSNGNLQRVKTLGITGGSIPSWSTTIGGTTSDGSMTWEMIGVGAQLPVLFSWTYAYSFHTNSPHTSTVSPLLVLQAPIIGSDVGLTALGSADTACDRNDLYRTKDGGSTLYYDTATTNVDGATSWLIHDTALDSDLNTTTIGPIALANTPPPAGMTLLAYHMNRMWGAVGNVLYFSAGPDCINGDGNQSWPPANNFTFAGNITGFAPTTMGLVVETPVNRSVVLGGPQTLTFWVQPAGMNFGIETPNCLVQDGDDIFIYTAQKQFFTFSPSSQEEIGHAIAGTMAAAFPSSSSYVALHRSGQDQGIFLSDGATNLVRYNLNTQSWDTLATPVGGIGPIASIDTAVGTRTLLSTAGGYIVGRDTTTFQDSGASYSGFATVGSLVLSAPGEDPAKIASFVLDSALVGTAPTLSVLPNEISGSFTSVPFSAADPWRLPASSTINMRRHDWNGIQTPLPNELKHIQVKVSLATEAFKNEIFNLSLLPPNA